MMSTTKAQAVDYIRRVLDKISDLTGLSSDAAEFIVWKRGALHAIASVFDNDTKHVRDFRRISFTSRFFAQNFSTDIDFFQSGLDQAKTVLESMLEEIEEYRPDDIMPIATHETPEMPDQQVSNRVFVVHGRDDGSRNTVARFLESLELEPIILQERPNEGRTIIQKFEDHSGVGFAVVLCTPDDVGALAAEQQELRPRPRQNVILELGFFWGKLGRKKVCALLDGDMDMPSDFGGVLYIPLDESEGWKLTLARELRAAGMNIDLNRIV